MIIKEEKYLYILVVLYTKMVGVLDKLFSGKQTSDDFSDDYVEITPSTMTKEGKARVVVRPFIIEDFADIKPALDALREGYTVALINIKPLKDKDLVELRGLLVN